MLSTLRKKSYSKAHSKSIRIHLLNLLNEHRSQFHRSDTINFIINMVVAFDQADVFHFYADLDHRGATLHFQVFDSRYCISIGKQIIIGVTDNPISRQRLLIGRPFVCADRIQLGHDIIRLYSGPDKIRTSEHPLRKELLYPTVLTAAQGSLSFDCNFILA